MKSEVFSSFNSGSEQTLPPARAKSTLTFRFIEFNERRAMRGADAARVAVIENGEEDWLWMNKRDIAKNMMAFGRCEELVKAHDAYKAFP